MRPKKLLAPAHQLRIGVDTGGTFTDFIAFSGRYRIAFKVPSTPDAPAEAILKGIAKVLSDPDLSAADSSVGAEIAHGTTVATNALLERQGARTALVTTAGFEDVIEIGRQARPDLYNLNVTRPGALVERELRFGVKERVDHTGRIIAALDVGEVVALTERLRRAEVESIAICLLFSFANPSHERAVADALGTLNLPISISHEILPEYREYERTSTVVVNAYLAPRVGRYLRALEAGLSHMIRASSERSRLRIMQSSGGSISAEVAAREPVRTILSGPAGGVVASLRVADLAEIPDIITFDMGGTSTDVALCQGMARTTNEVQLSGIPVAVPVIDIHTVGAGGGSIAFVDPGGALRVGPRSAGADPGPACYGKGTLPTVTDANLVLGRFGGEGLLSGEMTLDSARARKAIDLLAEELSGASQRRVTRTAAARGVIEVANINMEQALRLVSTEHGHDPRQFTLLSFGGAGGLHAVALAEALRIPKVLVPADPGTFSALGVLLSDVVRDYSRTVMLVLPPGSRPDRAVEKEFVKLEKGALADLRAEGFAGSKSRLVRSFAMRYRGQSFELDIPWSENPGASFHRAHRKRYGHGDALAEIEIVNLRLRAIGITVKPTLARHQAGRRGKVEAKGFASVVFVGRAGLRTPVIDRAKLNCGSKVEGPAIIVEYGSTTLVPPGWLLEVDSWLNLLLHPEASGR
ncbi:MAG: hydantoinase/oxoprolinase family protein [Acidobacteriota bacterium]